MIGMILQIALSMNTDELRIVKEMVMVDKGPCLSAYRFHNPDAMDGVPVFFPSGVLVTSYDSHKTSVLTDDDSRTWELAHYRSLKDSGVDSAIAIVRYTPYIGADVVTVGVEIGPGFNPNNSNNEHGWIWGKTTWGMELDELEELFGTGEAIENFMSGSADWYETQGSPITCVLELAEATTGADVDQPFWLDDLAVKTFLFDLVKFNTQED